MKGRRSYAGHLQDLPWNDVPGDSSVVSGSGEPDPAEVVGDVGDEHDLTGSHAMSQSDPYHRDTLGERLAEEEPEARLHSASEPAAERHGSPLSRGDVVVAEYPDLWRDPAPDDMSAEDAAMHLERR